MRFYRTLAFLFIANCFQFIYSCSENELENESENRTEQQTSEAEPHGVCSQTDTFLVYEVNPKIENVAFYWKDAAGENYTNFRRLKAGLKAADQELIFAVNGGMYTTTGAPLGLYIENGEVLVPLNKAKNSSGNFYLQPNGVFYLDKNKVPSICTTADFVYSETIEFATQSGPMLLIDGEIHPQFTQGSSNLNIRNGVGILPNGDLIFVLSKEEVNLYDFALYFKSRGCKNALYLDGFVSRTYLPQANYKSENGSFGVMIGVTVPQN